MGEYEARFVAQPANTSPVRMTRAQGLPRVSMVLRSEHMYPQLFLQTVYPDITVECEESGGHVTQESLFLPTQEYPWKKAWNTM